VVVLVAVANLSAWIFPTVDPRMFRGWSLMKANTGLLLILSALSLTLSRNRRSEQAAALGRLVGVCIFLVAAATLIEYWFHLSLGTDTLLAADSGASHPGRMAPQTAVAFSLLGIVTFWIRLREGIGSVVVDVFACGFCSLILVIVTGYVLGVLHFFGLSAGTVVAPQTLFCFVLLTIVIFARRAERGVLSIFVGNGVGSRIARIAAPCSLVVPFLLEAGRGQVLHARLFSPEYSAATVTVVAALLGFGLILTVAWRIEGLEQDVRDLSIRDELTKLYNRRGFLLMAERGLRLARRADSAFSVIFIDLDNLKKVNDTLGHDIGSTLIREMADLLTAAFRDTEIIGRIGGDEFVVAGTFGEVGVFVAVQRLEKAATIRNLEDGHSCNLGFSLGFVTSEAKDKESLESLMVKADAAMYEAKRKNKRMRDI
jgi:diguanylate cyclase (GGDEF)-like protein